MLFGTNYIITFLMINYFYLLKHAAAFDRVDPSLLFETFYSLGFHVFILEFFPSDLMCCSLSVFYTISLIPDTGFRLFSFFFSSLLATFPWQSHSIYSLKYHLLAQISECVSAAHFSSLSSISEMVLLGLHLYLEVL